MDIKRLVIKYIPLFVRTLTGNKEYIICIFSPPKNLYTFSRNLIVSNHIPIPIPNCKLPLLYKMFVVCDDPANLFILSITDIVNQNGYCDHIAVLSCSNNYIPYIVQYVFISFHFNKSGSLMAKDL